MFHVEMVSRELDMYVWNSGRIAIHLVIFKATRLDDIAKEMLVDIK